MIAIKGNVKQGKNIIETLKKLGGKHSDWFSGTDSSLAYYIAADGGIHASPSFIHDALDIDEFREWMISNYIAEKNHRIACGCGDEYKVVDFLDMSSENPKYYFSDGTTQEVTKVWTYPPDQNNYLLLKDTDIESNIIHVSEQIIGIEVPEGTTIKSFVDGVIYLKHKEDYDG